jgi:phosphopantothenoylcysteine decarboxylase/phosphopantothenate--cysteine ligase
MLNGKNILIGISGGIAAYKSVFLIRLLRKEGATVKVVVTKNALNFVTLLTLETISGNKVYSDVFHSPELYSTEHISITDWADLFIVAPATANIIGKLSNGIADDALSTSLLAFNKPLFIAPAMNCKMVDHFSVIKNMAFLSENGVHIIEPPFGELACGYEGKGRMEEPEKIVALISDFLKKKTSLLGKTALVTAGGTKEAIDPVRYIGNHSSGLMGFAIATELAERGAGVTLISGPSHLSLLHKSIKRIDVVSAADMHKACLNHFPKSDITVMAAAVADFTPLQAQKNKIKKKNSDDFTIKLKHTTDILTELGKQKKKKQLLVGFALETNNEIENAVRKLNEKNLDLIVLNSLKDKGAGFGSSTNKITIIYKNKHILRYGLKTKKEAASDIVNNIELLIRKPK